MSSIDIRSPFPADSVFYPYLCIAFRNKHSSDERCIMVKQKITPLKKQTRQTHLSRLYFLAKGCKHVPLEYARGIVRWGHPDGYFLNAQGQKVKDNFSPSSQNVRPNMHGRYPILRECVRECHILMALTFYGDRPTFTDKNSKPYVGICHHLINDKLDYRPANLLCWLTREQHTEADRRQRALRKVLPDMHAISYEKHRYLQDPRVTCREVFDVELEKIRLQYGKDRL